MKKFSILLLTLLIGVSCSSRKNAEEKVVQDAKAVEPVVDPRTQYARAISIIRSNNELKDDQKEKLIDVINTYASKSSETRLKQSQFRVVLVNEMLNTGNKENARVKAAKKNLMKLEKESSKNLGKFIRDFKHYAGNNISIHAPMREVIRVQ